MMATWWSLVAKICLETDCQMCRNKGCLRLNLTNTSGVWWWPPFASGGFMKKTSQNSLTLRPLYHMVFKCISLRIAQFSEEVWMLNRKRDTGPQSGSMSASARPFESKRPTITKPSPVLSNCPGIRLFSFSSMKISQVVSRNLSLGCSALPETNLKMMFMWVI